MNNNKGFTLTEILLAAMIVGVIGVALAALTTAAVRESGVGRTKAVLRNQLSVAMRQLQQDVHQASAIHIDGAHSGFTLSTKGEAYKLGPDIISSDSVTYRFTAGTISGGAGGKTGGSISRNGSAWLMNVKSITSDGKTYPYFFLENTGTLESRLRIQLIVEVASNPIVNEYVDETFVLPQGFAIQ